MAIGYSQQALRVLDGTMQMADGAQVWTHDKSNMVTVTGASLVAQGVGAPGDAIVLFDFPAESIPSAIAVQSDTVLTGVTLNFGIAGNPTKYGLLVAPAANSRYVLDSVAVRMLGPITSKEQLIMTVAGAALPAAFNLTVKMGYVVQAS